MYITVANMNVDIDIDIIYQLQLGWHQVAVVLIDSTTGNALRPYVGRPFVPHIWNGSFRHLQRHSASTDARGLY
jgi:hypothetical protein